MLLLVFFFLAGFYVIIFSSCTSRFSFVICCLTRTVFRAWIESLSLRLVEKFFLWNEKQILTERDLAYRS